MKLRKIILIPFSLLFLVGVNKSTSAKESPQTLCKKNEQIFFNCKIKKTAKLISLCGSRPLTKEKGVLQYRFGVLNAVELEFPKTLPDSQKQFFYSHYFRPRVDRTSVNFKNSGYAYSLYIDYEGGEGLPSHDEAGVQVTSPNSSQTTDLSCQKPWVNKLGDLQAILPCDPSNPTGGDCS